jgi:hypothetical protein
MIQRCIASRHLRLVSVQQLPLYKMAKRTIISDIFSKVKSIITSYSEKKNTNEKNPYGKVDKLIDESIPNTGVMSFITKRIWKSIGMNYVRRLSQCIPLTYAMY